MANELALKFRRDLDDVHRVMISVPSEVADVSWREGGWTRKQIVGHLLDSATNNRQRFVRAALDNVYAGPGYEQDAWVAAHGYADQSWETLLRWWEAEHEILTAVVDHIPLSRLHATCNVGDEAPVTLQFLIEDYVRHQYWHLRQITTGTSLT